MRVTLIIFVFLLFASCRKEAPYVPPPDDPVVPAPEENAKPIVLRFHNQVDGAALQPGVSYVNPSGDTFQVSKFNYYISNVSLVKTDNSLVPLPNTYFLIESGNPASQTVELKNIPAGNYSGLKFMIGVDSARNCSGAQTGALDPSLGMFWSWNSGYIMLKLEGTSPASGAINKHITFHVGGFGGLNKVQRWCAIPFGTQTAVAGSVASSTVHLSSNVNELFRTPGTVSFSNLYYVMSPGANAKLIADNYADMITFQSLE